MAFLSGVIDQLGKQFGSLDNQVEKWTNQGLAIDRFLPIITDSLANHFPSESYPVMTFKQASARYQSLRSGLTDTEKPARGYLNLRFYIMLNGFLAACQESLEKAAWNDSLDPTVLLEKSYYTPYFFERVTYTREEIISLIDEDIARLENSPQDQKGVLTALRIRKGTALTLTESYCPLHPRLYPLVAALEQVPVSKDPAVIIAILDQLRAIRDQLSN
jgi:hypothetical protein